MPRHHYGLRMPPRWNPPPRSLFRRAELLERGIHPRRLASPEFTEVLPGFYTPADAPAHLALVARVLQRKVLPGAVISHTTGAEILGMPLPWQLEYCRTGVLHCSVLPGEKRRAGPRVHVHRPRPLPTRNAFGVRLRPPLALLCEVAGELEHGELVACCDHLIGPYAARPRMNLADLHRLLEKTTGMHGIKRVRRAITDARERVESPRETMLRLLLIEHGFAEPEINRTVRTPSTGESFRLDLCYARERLAIEYDGDWHRTDRRRFRSDRRKDDVLHELGWRVVRVTEKDLRDPSRLIGRLRHLGAPTSKQP